MKKRERSSMVEYQLPKLATGVRFPSLAPFQSVTGGIEARERRATRGKGLCPTANELATQASSASRSSRFPSLAPFALIFIFATMLAGCATVPETYTTQPVEYTAAPSTKSVFWYPKVQGMFAWPVRGEITSYFGSKIGRVKNKGIDIKASEGTSVRAAKAGKVVFCDDQLKGFGKTVILDHGNKFQTVYSYNSKILVRVGDVVEQNMVIAKVGRTGRATQPTLHFEIRKDGSPQNPVYYLRR